MWKSVGNARTLKVAESDKSIDRIYPTFEKLRLSTTNLHEPGSVPQ